MTTCCGVLQEGGADGEGEEGAGAAPQAAGADQATVQLAWTWI